VERLRLLANSFMDNVVVVASARVAKSLQDAHRVRIRKDLDVSYARPLAGENFASWACDRLAKVRYESRRKGNDGLIQGVREKDGLSLEHQAGQPGLREIRESTRTHALMTQARVI
jgi:hypothetical protein